MSHSKIQTLFKLLECRQAHAQGKRIITNNKKH